MKRNISSVFGGVALILAGGVLLADRLGWVDFSRFSTNTWVFVFAGLSLAFFISYFLIGVHEWGWLFPAFIFAALSQTVWMVDQGTVGSFIGMPILLAIALPFYIGFAFNRKNWGLLIPAWILTVLALITLIAETVAGNLIGALFLFSVSVPFLIVFLLNRTKWWALIPAWVTFILGLIALLSEQVDGNLIGALFMYSVALPFLVVYLLDRNKRWALIPAIAIALVGTLPLISSVTSGEWIGALVMFLFSAPFFFVFFRWRDHWWSLLPAGIFASIGLVALLGVFFPMDQPLFQGIFTGILLLCFGLTFGVLWLQRASLPTAWARFPAIGLFIAAVLAFFIGGDTDLFWPVALLVAGIAIVAFGILRKKPGGGTKS